MSILVIGIGGSQHEFLNRLKEEMPEINTLAIGEPVQKYALRRDIKQIDLREEIKEQVGIPELSEHYAGDSRTILKTCFDEHYEEIKQAIIDGTSPLTV